jgi:hypothetical protein
LFLRLRAQYSKLPPRKPDLHEAGVKAAIFGWSVLKHHQRGAAPFASKANALDNAQQDQQDWREDPDRIVGRQQADAKSV